MIGDPSGKSAERNLLSAEQIAANVAGIQPFNWPLSRLRGQEQSGTHRQQHRLAQ